MVMAFLLLVTVGGEAFNTQGMYFRDINRCNYFAQEIEEVLPEAVKDRGSGYKGVQYDKIIPLLIEGIKELTKKTKKLEKEIRVLRHKS